MSVWVMGNTASRRTPTPFQPIARPPPHLGFKGGAHVLDDAEEKQESLVVHPPKDLNQAVEERLPNLHV